MKSKLYLSIAALACFLCVGTTTGFAASNADLERRIEALEGKSLAALSQRITFSGAIELDFTYDEESPDNRSDLSVGCVELGLEAQLHDYVTANLLLNGENLDDDGEVSWDEVFFTISKDGFPVYFNGGKRCQPFGVFESLFINDPITQELYEINDTGVTLGFAQENIMGLDLSFTLYKGTPLFGQIADNEGAWESNPYAGAIPVVNAKETDEANSYIVSASLSPIEGLSFGLFYNSEPGNGDRNTTAGAMVHFEMAGFIADAEYIGALEREKVNNKEYKENAWTVSLGYQVMEPLLVAARYEAFDGDQDKAGDLESRYSLGATYTLFANDTFACNLLGEYRHSDIDAAAGDDDTADEYAARLAIEF